MTDLFAAIHGPVTSKSVIPVQPPEEAAHR
jgi:hypothetical protein